MAVPDPAWAALRGPLPEHQDEVMTAHKGTGGTGTPAPPEDHGQDDVAKYGGN